MERRLDREGGRRRWRATGGKGMERGRESRSGGRRGGGREGERGGAAVSQRSSESRLLGEEVLEMVGMRKIRKMNLLKVNVSF